MYRNRKERRLAEAQRKKKQTRMDRNGSRPRKKGVKYDRNSTRNDSRSRSGSLERDWKRSRKRLSKSKNSENYRSRERKYLRHFHRGVHSNGKKVYENSSEMTVDTYDSGNSKEMDLVIVSDKNDGTEEEMDGDFIVIDDSEDVNAITDCDRVVHFSKCDLEIVKGSNDKSFIASKQMSLEKDRKENNRQDKYNYSKLQKKKRKSDQGWKKIRGNRCDDDSGECEIDSEVESGECVDTDSDSEDVMTLSDVSVSDSDTDFSKDQEPSGDVDGTDVTETGENCANPVVIYDEPEVYEETGWGFEIVISISK